MKHYQSQFLNSFCYIHNILQQIIQKTIHQLHQKYIANKIPQYCETYLQNIVNQMFTIYDFQSPQNSLIIMDQQPNSTQIDNLMPGFLNLINKQEISRNKEQNIMNQTESKIFQQQGIESESNRKTLLNINKLANEHKKQQNSKQQFIMIDDNLQKQEEDDRMMKFLKEKKANTIKMMKAYPPLPNRKDPEKKIKIDTTKGKQLAFGFNGQLLKINEPRSAHLVKNILQAKIVNQQNIDSENKSSVDLNSSNQMKPQTKNIKNKKIRKKPLQNQKQREDLGLTKDIPIEEFQLVQGVKIITSRKIKQNIKRPITIKDLQQLNDKQVRLTRDDYLRLKRLQTEGKQSRNSAKQSRQNYNFSQNSKQLNINKIDGNINTQTNNTPLIKQIKQHPVKSTSASSQKYRSRLVISNQKLKTMHLTHLEKGNTQQLPQNSKILDNHNNKYRPKPLQTVAPTDQHLEFLMKKSNEIMSPILNTVRATQVLPDVKHKNVILPKKTRQRIKNEKQILLELNKKFQDRLRTATISNIPQNK